MPKPLHELQSDPLLTFGVDNVFGGLWDGGVTNGKLLGFGGFVVFLPILRSSGIDVKGLLKTVMAVTRDNSFNVICKGETVC